MGRLASVLIALGVASTAWADFVDPSSLGCRVKELGAECPGPKGAPGTCAQAVCVHEDHSFEPPEVSEEDCVMCVTADSAPMVAGAVARRQRQKWTRYGLALGVVFTLSVVGGSWIKSRRKRR